MRPVKRGRSPQATDFANYEDAKATLVSRLGRYCSYCERHVATNLAVEHVQPKGLAAYAHLSGRWENFLLGCVNCNSTKKNKDLVLADTFLPDRDNTFAVFDYLADGRIEPSSHTPPPLKALAERLLSVVGLDKPITEVHDENGKQVALDRVAQRLEVWAIAQEAKMAVDRNPGVDAVKDMAVVAAKATGFFSIWMTVFANDAEMRNRLIDVFPGTRGSACFDPVTTQALSPAPNPDGLPNGGKL